MVPTLQGRTKFLAFVLAAGFVEPLYSYLLQYTST